MLEQIDRQTEAKLLERIDTTKLESHVDAFVQEVVGVCILFINLDNKN